MIDGNQSIGNKIKTNCRTLSESECPDVWLLKDKLASLASSEILAFVGQFCQNKTQQVAYPRDNWSTRTVGRGV